MIREAIRTVRCLAAAVMVAAAVLLGIVPAVLAIVAAVPCILVCMAGGAVGVLLGRFGLWILPSRDAIEAAADPDQPEAEPVPEDFATNWGNPYLSKL